MTIPFRKIREVRRARRDEAARVVELAAAAPSPLGGGLRDAEAVLAWMGDTQRMLYVAAPIGEEAVGVVALSPLGGGAGAGAFAVPLLFVVPAARGRGWGASLLDAALTFARRRGAGRVVVQLADGVAPPASFVAAARRTPSGADGGVPVPPHGLEFDPHEQLARSAR